VIQRAIVVGASSGIGAELVVQLACQGYRVMAVARRGDALTEVCARANEGLPEPRATAWIHDVTDHDGAPAAFRAIVERLDGLDLLIYSAGVMPDIGPEQFDAAIDRHIFEVNTIGAITWLDLAAERMLAQRSGTIVGIGSVAGDRGRRGNPAYCASKAALHTFLESLRNRLSQHGVRVVTVKPGPVDTPMTAGRDKLPLLIDAERAAREIVAALPSGGTRYVPVAWAPIMTVVRSIPSVVFRRMNF
jgi:decaprenylphospho-beta-D-erythro-pentofuranosid-2-ulose 2-reductase